MLGEKQVIEIRILSKKGITNREIAREMVCHENTVSKYLKEDWKEMKGISKLDPYKEHRIKRLEEYPSVKCTVLFKEIKAQGYTGGITIVRMYVHSIRPEDEIESIRFETAPGKQFQADWGEGETRIGGKSVVIKFFTMVLGYSRMLYAQIVNDEKLETLLQAHNKAFEYFGGYPHEGLYDNMKAVVKSLERKKEYNVRFTDFADFYGFRIITHRPYNPKAKGKVERMVPYVRNNILYAQSYSSLSELENTLFDWLVLANQRLHSYLKETPLERFEREKEYLNKLTRFYPLRRLNTRLVRESGQVIYKERAYWVPEKYTGKKVNLQAEGQMLKIYCEDDLINTQPLKDQVEVRSLKEYQRLVGA